MAEAEGALTEQFPSVYVEGEGRERDLKEGSPVVKDTPALSS